VKNDKRKRTDLIGRDIEATHFSGGHARTAALELNREDFESVRVLSRVSNE
jgi:hypothetical protein